MDQRDTQTKHHRQIISDFENVTLPENVSTVLLDLDNTCYHYESCHTKALSTARGLLEMWHGALEDFTARYKAAQHRVKNRIPHHAASHSRVLYFQTLLEDLHDQRIFERCTALEEVYWSEFMRTMTPTRGLVSFLARCQEHDTKVVVVSDLTTTLQCKKLVALGIASYITAMVTSEEAGTEKPDARCFTLALEKAGDQAKNAVMIGDSLDRDIIGAEQLGITTIQFIHAEATDSTEDTPLR